MTLSHMDQKNRPRMVDVGEKAVTRRTARARAVLHFPPGLVDQLEPDGEDRVSRKGSIIQTATLAGIMAAKRTSELIPLCHLIPLDHCQIEIQPSSADEWTIDCTVRTEHKTGVEMEALTGATVAALTVYDMCKALSHEIIVRDVRLIEKHGGRRDVSKEP